MSDNCPQCFGVPQLEDTIGAMRSAYMQGWHSATSVLSANASAYNDHWSSRISGAYKKGFDAGIKAKELAEDGAYHCTDRRQAE